MLGRRVSIEIGLSVVRLPYSSLSAAELDTCMFPSDNRYLVVRLRFEQDFTARLFVKISLRRLLFRKNVHAYFYGLSGIDSVVTDFDTNIWCCELVCLVKYFLRCIAFKVLGIFMPCMLAIS